MSSRRLNESLIAILGELAAMKTDNQFISRAYSNAQETIMKIDEDITDINQLRGKPGIGSTIIEKLTEFVKTGKIAKLEKYKTNPVSVFSEIYGIGPKKAEELAKLGFAQKGALLDGALLDGASMDGASMDGALLVAELRKQSKLDPKLLNGVQKIGLQYYENILERIPRQEIDDYDKVFSKAIGKGQTYEIVGSYRRGAASSGDIDVIITAPSVADFDQFLDTLIRQHIINEVLSRGKSKCLVIASLPGRRGGFVYRRVDFLFTTRAEFPFSILYFTGSKGFNVVMRKHALSMGYSMNEHGLTDKITGQPVANEFRTEADIFEFLGLEYKRPEERIDGRSVKPSIDKPVSPLVLPKSNKTLKRKSKCEQQCTNPQIDKIKQIASASLPTETTTQILGVIDGPIVNKSAVTSHQDKPNGSTSEKLNEIASPPKQDKLKKPKTKKIINKMATKKTTQKATKKDAVFVNELPESLLKLFTESGISVLESLSESQLTQMVLKANEVYYNTGVPLITDNQYDIIKEYTERKFPANTAIKEVGAPIVKNKVVLPYEMASMDKIKPESGALATWTAKYKGPYILSAKLDGVSGLYTCEGEEPRLYTRGDGKVGQDVSHLTRVLSLPCIPGLVVRGEFILRKSVFDTKYKGTFATARNLVAGIVNAKTIDDKTRDLDFVVYEVIKPVMKPSGQMETLLAHGFNTVWNTTTKSLTNEMLSETLHETRSKYEYETDGIIVANDAVYPRSSGNPDHAFAFKMAISDQMAEAKVVDVLWEVSQDGYFKPRVRIEPINIAGVNIEYTTGFNGKFIEENRIGVGAVVQIIRSGDVIPYIREIIAPAEKAKMPDAPYIWTQTRVDIMVENAAEDPTVKRKNVVGFFLELDVKGLGESNLKKMIEAGHDTVPKIIALTLPDLEKVFGQGKTAPAMYEGIKNKIAESTLSQLMVASNMFGRGIGNRLVSALMKEYPDFLTAESAKEVKLEMLSRQGIKKNGEQFYDAIMPFRRFLEECGLLYKLEGRTSEGRTSEVNSSADKSADKPINTSSPLFNKSIVMTKVRDAPIIEYLKQVGATLDDTMKTTTFVLIVKDRADTSSKTKYAEARGIPIMTVEEFKTQFMN